MHHALQTIQQPQAAPSSARRLWIAVGALSIAVAALGGVLMGMQLGDTVPAQGTALQSRVNAGQAAALEPFGSTPRTTAAVTRNTVVAPARTVAAPVRTSLPAQQTPVQAARCDDCGTVLSVAPVQREGQANGVGAVAGAVAGGVVGNQIGGGSGRAVATVLGALGGGWAGNAVEKKVRQTTHYAVRVRMNDGRVRTLEQPEPLAVGSPVLVQGGVARVATAQSRVVAVRG